MSQHILVRALMCLAAPSVCVAGTPVEPSDSLSSVLLQEITVKTKPVIAKADGNTYIPSSEKKRTATSGLDLLQKMQLPLISVNPLTGAVHRSGGGTVKLCINGVEATSSEIAAIRPDDIMRIEYHDNPGTRYSGADAVIDYITRAKTSGANISVDGMEALGSGKWAMFNNLAAGYNHGASSWAFNAGVAGLQRDNWVRDYEETWNYPDHSVTRRETGMPVTIGMHEVETALNYTLRKDGKYFFNARAAVNINRIPNKEEGDRHTLLQTSGSDIVTEINEHTRESGTTPAIALFSRIFTARAQSVTASLSGSYMHSTTLHSYNEKIDGTPAANIATNATGNKYSILAEAYYDARIDASHFTAGARHSQSNTRNRYTGAENADVKILMTESSLFGDYDITLSKFNLNAGLTATRLASSQNATSNSNYSINPGAGISFEPSAALRLRYDFRMQHKQPPIAAMNNIEQPVQPGLVRKGNPGLRPFRIITQRLTASFYHPIVSADLLVDYRNERNPVMATTLFDGNRFVMTYANQPSFQELRTELSLTVRPWGEHLSIALAPALSRYFSHGHTYTHIRNIFHLGVNIDFSYGNFIFNASVMTGAANSMYGEEIISEKDMNMIVAGYKRPKWSVQAGVFNAFMNNYWMKTENMSALTPYISNAHCNRNAYAVVKFSLNLNFGRETPETGIPGQPLPDSDSGIMNSLK